MFDVPNLMISRRPVIIVSTAGDALVLSTKIGWSMWGVRRGLGAGIMCEERVYSPCLSIRGAGSSVGVDNMREKKERMNHLRKL